MRNFTNGWTSFSSSSRWYSAWDYLYSKNCFWIWCIAGMNVLISDRNIIWFVPKKQLLIKLYTAVFNHLSKCPKTCANKKWKMLFFVCTIQLFWRISDILKIWTVTWMKYFWQAFRKFGNFLKALYHVFSLTMNIYCASQIIFLTAIIDQSQYFSKKCTYFFLLLFFVPKTTSA